MGLSKWCHEGRNLEVKTWWAGVESVGLQEDTTTYSQKSTCASWQMSRGRHWYVYFVDLASGVYNPPLHCKKYEGTKMVGSTRYRALPHSSETTNGSQHITTINYNRSIIPDAGFCSGAIIMMKRLIHMIFWRIEKKSTGDWCWRMLGNNDGRQIK